MTTTLALLLSLAAVSSSAAAIQGEADTQSAQAIYAARCSMCHGTVWMLTAFMTLTAAPRLGQDPVEVDPDHYKVGFQPPTP